MSKVLRENKMSDLELVRKEIASVGTKFDNLEKKFSNFEGRISKFIEQYELDMRGNKDINGKKGIVNEIREIKKHIKDNPSILWLLKNRTLKSILTIFGIGLFTYFIGTVIFMHLGPTALLQTFLKFLGIPII